MSGIITATNLQTSNIKSATGNASITVASDGTLTTTAPTLTNIKNTSTFNSDGGAVNKNLVQGLCKAWYVFDGGRTTSSTSIEDDFNIASLVDNGTGDTTLTFTSNMNSATTYTVVNSTFLTATASDISGCVGRTTSTHIVQDLHDEGSATDMERTYGAVFGDLA